MPISQWPEIWSVHVNVSLLLRNQGGTKGVIHSDILLAR